MDGVGGYGTALDGAGDDTVLVTTSGDWADLPSGKKVRGHSARSNSAMRGLVGGLVQLLRARR